MTLREAIEQLFAEEHTILSANQVIKRLYTKYPEQHWKKGAIHAHLIGLSVNHPSSRHHLELRPHAFLFSLGEGRYRRWIPDLDGTWEVTDQGVRRVDSSREANTHSATPVEPFSAGVTSVSTDSSTDRALGYPGLTTAEVAFAYSLGKDVYPLLFILENSIRSLVTKKLAAVTNNWWSTEVPTSVQQNVQRTMRKEERYRYRERRGEHPLMYANFADLKEIILNRQAIFSDVINDFEWFKVRMDEVYMARNNVAHCVPLSDDDQARIKVFYGDWERLLRRSGIG